MDGLPTLIVNMTRFNNTINLSNKNKATQLFGYSMLTSRLVLHNVVSIAALEGFIPFIATF